MIHLDGSDIAERAGEGGHLSEPDLLGIVRSIVRTFVKRAREYREEDLLGPAWGGVASALERIDPSRPERQQRSYVATAVFNAIVAHVRKDAAARRAEPIEGLEVEDTAHRGPNEQDLLRSMLDGAGVTDPIDRRLAMAAWAGGPEVDLKRHERKARLARLRARLARTIDGSNRP